jgi:phage tail sheath protein FI
MVNYVSPGVYVIEKDTSDYPVSVNPSVIGIVGFASKGPNDRATLITNGERLQFMFGNPNNSIIGQGLEGALEILETTNSLYYIRATDPDFSADASATVKMGQCPTVALVGETFGGADGCVLTVNGTKQDGTKLFTLDTSVVIPAGQGLATEAALAKAVGGLDSSKLLSDTQASNHYLAGAFAGHMATLSVSAWEPDGTSPATILKTLDSNGDTLGTLASIVTASGMTYDSGAVNSAAYLAESLYPGTGYNLTTDTNGTVTGNSITVTTTGGTKSTLSVNDEGVSQEDFIVGFTTSGFIETEINTDIEGLKSSYIKGNIQDDGSDSAITTGLPSIGTALVGNGVTASLAGVVGGALTAGTSDGRFTKLVDGTYALSGGTDGIPTTTTDIADALIGNAADKTGMQLLDDDLLGVGIALVPGISDQDVQNNLVTLAEKNGSFLALLAPPAGTNSAQDAIDWSNGTSVARTAAITSSYAAIYWPWVKVFSQFDKTDRWYDPSIFAARQMAYTDDISDSWFAPAGFVRGRLTKPTDVEVRLSQGDRDAMYSGGNVVNPIVNFPGQGITIYGQRTAQRTPTALDRVNVRRMMIIIKKIILQSTGQFAFEPNDAGTWKRVASLTTQLIDPIARGRGITAYKVQCDETTNTPARIEKGEMWCKVVIRPTKTAEIIVFELNLVNQSASV